MSTNIKRKLKNVGKIFAIILFVVILFSNLKIALTDENKITNGDISILGIELTLFEGTKANKHVLACNALGCSYLGDHVCGAYGTGGEVHICWEIIVRG